MSETNNKLLYVCCEHELEKCHIVLCLMNKILGWSYVEDRLVSLFMYSPTLNIVNNVFVNAKSFNFNIYLLSHSLLFLFIMRFDFISFSSPNNRFKIKIADDSTGKTVSLSIS